MAVTSAHLAKRRREAEYDVRHEEDGLREPLKDRSPSRVAQLGIETVHEVEVGIDGRFAGEVVMDDVRLREERCEPINAPGGVIGTRQAKVGRKPVDVELQQRRPDTVRREGASI